VSTEPAAAHIAYPWWVPVTLRSRFREFFIMPPDAEQAIQLSRSVVKNALIAAGFGSEEPDRRIVVALAHMSAREIHKVMLTSAASATWRGALEVGMQDLPREITASTSDVETARPWVH
jgi:hypothetical protein